MAKVINILDYKKETAKLEVAEALPNTSNCWIAEGNIYFSACYVLGDRFFWMLSKNGEDIVSELTTSELICPNNFGDNEPIKFQDWLLAANVKLGY